MRTWGLAALALTAAVLSACSRGVPAPQAAPTARATTSPTVVVSGAPAQQVLALVPEAATILTVTDFARVRDQLGDDGHQGAGIWERADESAPLLTRGMFREGIPTGSGAGSGSTSSRLRQADVLWEAHFTGGAAGYVVRFADSTDLTGIAPPAGARVRADEHLLVSGVATAPGDSWASVPGMAQLVPGRPEAAYVQRGCLPGDGADGADGLERLDAYSVELGSSVATVRMGAGRRDLFVRMRLGEASAGFTRVFADGAADPSSGRIGYRLADPVEAADLTLRQRLPFAVCAR